MRDSYLGTVLDKNKVTSNIFERFKDFFTVLNEKREGVKFVVSKMPSDELAAELKKYYVDAGTDKAENDKIALEEARVMALERTLKSSVLYTSQTDDCYYFAVGDGELGGTNMTVEVKKRTGEMRIVPPNVDEFFNI